ncbi:AAA family ATPase [Actinoplanes sp. NBC_00393]|uniref:AAA family ATPase n=1 Tax=Actinoplanes sp. NBC_00393 TaxID=2975953 RepID=UPI002E202B3C
MDDVFALYHELTERLRSSGAAGSVTDLILAAYQGDDVLAATIGGQPLPQPSAGSGTESETPYVFLESVQVTGFRGIGSQAAMRLKPEPGLNVFVGRNGSGKSSFAEAVEYGLTEETARWSKRPPVFREGWRNLHHDGDREITMKLRLGVDGRPVTVRRAWPAGTTDLAAATVTTTQGGGALPTGELPSWAGPVDRYRPFLAARDLERVVSAKPSELYDAIAPILGLEQLGTAAQRLQTLRKGAEDRVKEMKAAFTQLRAGLAELDDPRAREAAVALGGQAAKADLEVLVALATSDGSTEDAAAAAAARRLADQVLPDAGRVLAELEEAAETVRDLAGTGSAVAHRTAGLLERALEMHRDEGDQSCPVCRVGALDDSWRRQAEAELERLAAAAAAVRAADERHAELRRQVGELLSNVRNAVTPVATVLAAHLPDESAVVSDALAELVPEPAVWATFVAAHAELVRVAGEWLARWHGAWAEPSAAIRRWVDMATAVRHEAGRLELLTKARAELVKVTDDMRADRFKVASAQSQAIWELLRQESNVAVGEIKLGGNATRRRVDIPVTVDGTGTPALAVMSQGELHSFGLALFLPRACAAASPYRFVVIDDPVQSMDPSKVDGLARVLHEVSLTRQVLVFTHDDRLPEAIRRLDIKATVFEVTRRDGSAVEVRKACDPADRYLDDARAVAGAVDIPEEAKYLLVAGFCRSAIEAVAMDRYRAERYEAGVPYVKIAESVGSAHTVKDKLALGLFGDVGRRGELLSYLNRNFGARAADVVQAVAGAVHGHRNMPSRAMVAGSIELVGRLR